MTAQDAPQDQTRSQLGPDFRSLWHGQIASMVGSQVGDVAIRLLVATVLAATPLQLGLLSAAQTAAFLIVGLPAGVWLDRVRCRSVLIVADIVRAVLLATIPVAWWLGYLSFAQVLAVVFFSGIAHVFFDVGYQTYLPRLVDREQLVVANARLESSRSAAAAAGPASAGALIQAMQAANVILINAVTYILSAVMIRRIKSTEALPPARPRNIRAEIRDGLRFVVRHPILRALSGAAATYNFCYGMLLPTVIVLLVTDLGLTEGMVGLLFTCAGIGGFGGALIARRVIERVGLAKALIATEIVAGPLVLALMLTAPGWGLIVFAVSYLLLHLALSIFNVASVSLRQSLCPHEFMGRVTASMRFVASGALPLGGRCRWCRLGADRYRWHAPPRWLRSAWHRGLAPGVPLA
ncbi:MFS transporter [Nocardiopsis sp. CNT312]|uniref:MFS transporter n=1 Tax=Nocardiopsis sp. CNT312 TaxID=1137268 RepID=UPI0009DCC6E9|nr:MFS transporter [Nocardiopsis sp. CNT312]